MLLHPTLTRTFFKRNIKLISVPNQVAAFHTYNSTCLGGSGSHPAGGRSLLGKPLLGIKDHYSNALFIHLSGTKIYIVKIKPQDITLLFR